VARSGWISGRLGLEVRGWVHRQATAERASQRGLQASGQIQPCWPAVAWWCWLCTRSAAGSGRRVIAAWPNGLVIKRCRFRESPGGQALACRCRVRGQPSEPHSRRRGSEAASGICSRPALACATPVGRHRTLKPWRWCVSWHAAGRPSGWSAPPRHDEAGADLPSAGVGQVAALFSGCERENRLRCRRGVPALGALAPALADTTGWAVATPELARCWPAGNRGGAA